MKTGDVVMSLKGHDSGKLYVVVAAEKEFVFLCDGKNKLLKNPKKKKIKHLKETGKSVNLSLYNPLYDAHIRKELKIASKSVDTIICL